MREHGALHGIQAGLRCRKRRGDCFEFVHYEAALAARARAGAALASSRATRSARVRSYAVAASLCARRLQACEQRDSRGLQRARCFVAAGTCASAAELRGGQMACSRVAVAEIDAATDATVMLPRSRWQRHIWWTLFRRGWSASSRRRPIGVRAHCCRSAMPTYLAGRPATAAGTDVLTSARFLRQKTRAFGSCGSSSSARSRRRRHRRRCRRAVLRLPNTLGSAVRIACGGIAQLARADATP